MSNLLSQASLVMIPSGYKEDVVYSPIPTNGNGDLSFTRASDGTRVNSAGLVEDCPWNLVTYSEEFNIGVWTIAQISVSANTTTAPNGTTTADTITTSSTGICYIYQGFSLIGGVFTLSVYAKKGNNDFIAINNQSTSTNWVTAVFDLTDGTFGEYAVGSGGGFTYISNNIESVGNGWYRCSLVFSGVTNNTTYPSIMFAPSKTGNTFTSSYGETSGNASGKTLFIWGAQLNIGATAKPYFPTTDRLNVPRLTYQNGGGGCPSLLLEKQSTNLALYSEQINSTNYNLSNVTSSENSLTSPDGTTNADKIIESTSNSTHAVTVPVSLGGTVDSSPYCISVFAKAEGRSQILFYDNNQLTSGISYFNLSTGVVSSGTGKIENYGNGWYRCTIFCLKDFSTSANIQLYLLDSAGNQTYTGNGTSAIGLWGYQCEASSYPTSYIPTTSSSATRVADACVKTGISSLIGQTEGVIFIDFEIQTTNEDMVVMNIYNGSNGIYFYLNGSNKLYAYVDNGATQVNIASGVLAQGRYKAAFVYKANDFAFYLNGSLIGVDVSGTVPTCNALRLENYAPSPTYQEKIQVYQAILFPTRLTNAELASLTTL